MPHGGIRYWGYRIDTRAIPFFKQELLEQCRLRQGWGYDEGQNLRKMKVDAGAGRNRRMFDEVKKGHILLVPRLPSWSEVAIVEATKDWNTAYQFEIPATKDDYGHIFPARFCKAFSRHNEHICGDLRATLRTPSRFWNIDRLECAVQDLLDRQEDLTSDISGKERFENAIQDAFTSVSDQFRTKAYEDLNRWFSAASWENALVEVFRAIYPGCEVLHTGGSGEKTHGTDILIRIPGLGRQPHQTRYAIAVQVKDYEGQVSDSKVTEIMKQISQADSWKQSSTDSGEDLVLVEKVVLITKAKKTDNARLVEAGAGKVRFVFADDLKDILADYARRRWGLTPTPD